MKIRDIRRYIFINIFVICMFIIWLVQFFSGFFGYKDVVRNFVRIMASFAFWVWVLFLLEVLIRYIIEVKTCKKEEHIPVWKNIYLKFFDGLYTVILWICAFYAPLIAMLCGAA